MLGYIEGFIWYNSLVVYERSSEWDRGESLLGLNDNIKYDDKALVDYSKLGE